MGRRTLNTLVKNSPAKATGAHVSIIAHITVDELARELTATEMANGFGNRFLFFCARRSKSLPEGGDLGAVDWTPMINRLKDAISFPKSGTVAALPLDLESRERWWRVYPGLTDRGTSLFDAITSRAEAHVRRLAVIYAVLDREREVRIEHLEAALAVWDYAERSAAYLFGSSLGDPMADQVLSLLRRHPDGMSRTGITNALSRNKKADEIERALGVLSERGMAEMEKVQPPSGRGRPEERWRAT